MAAAIRAPPLRAVFPVLHFQRVRDGLLFGQCSAVGHELRELIRAERTPQHGEDSIVFLLLGVLTCCVS